MRIGSHILAFICLLFLSSVIVLSEDFKWEPVPVSDWNIAVDSAKGIRDAVMIFEKVVQNDRDMSSNNYYFSVYRRIRIFTPERKS